MNGRVDSRELRRFVVRISGPAGNTLGTGFFAAPGWVVTCAHVVGDLREAIVTPASPRVPLAPAGWPVVARSDLPPAGWRSAFWPYPDLAVLRADGEVEHPCPLLEARDPAGECYSWGFPQVEQGIEPSGGPASFDFEGVTGGDFLQLKAGQAAPGISGAPLVCPSLRAVVGVVAVSRDIGSALGGWASPLSALLAGGEGVPEDLAGAGEEIRQANRAAVIRYRREWNAVASRGGRRCPGSAVGAVHPRAAVGAIKSAARRLRGGALPVPRRRTRRCRGVVRAGRLGPADGGHAGDGAWRGR